MIPKTLIQTSKTKPNQKVVEKIIKQLGQGWQYIHFCDEEIFDFFDKNPHDDFPEISDFFSNIENGAHKSDLFRYYFLYLKGGVYLDSDAMIYGDINKYVENYDFFTVISGSLIFQGFIASEKNNTIIEKALKDLFSIDINVLSKDYHILCRRLSKIIEDEKKFCKSFLFQETVKPNGGYIFDPKDEKPIVIHYYHKPAKLPLQLTTDLKIEASKTIWPDEFDIKEHAGELTITRIDKECGWGQNLHLIVTKDSNEKRAIKVGSCNNNVKKIEVDIEQAFRRDISKIGIINALEVRNLDSKKIRIGINQDGGYVVNNSILSKASRLITFGINVEDSFERDWLKIKNTPIECYDESCYCGRLCKENIEIVNKSIFHVNKFVGYGKDEIPINVIVEGKKNALLKVDTEGAEYEMFDNVDLNDLCGIIIEFHDLDIEEKRAKLIELIKTKFSMMSIFHIHGNNWGNVFALESDGLVIENFPKVIEISFAKKGLCADLGLEMSSLPMAGIDFPNNPKDLDLSLDWINATLK